MSSSNPPIQTQSAAILTQSAVTLFPNNNQNPAFCKIQRVAQEFFRSSLHLPNHPGDIGPGQSLSNEQSNINDNPQPQTKPIDEGGCFAKIGQLLSPKTQSKGNSGKISSLAELSEEALDNAHNMNTMQAGLNKWWNAMSKYFQPNCPNCIGIGKSVINGEICKNCLEAAGICTNCTGTEWDAVQRKRCDCSMNSSGVLRDKFSLT